jgi:hypothetical protein
MIETIEPLMFLLAPIVFAVFVGVPLLVLLWIAQRRDRPRDTRPGFEMKPTSGPSPEQREREAYHG